VLVIYICVLLYKPALTLLFGHQEEHHACKKFEWYGAGVVICLERGADDLHMVQLMSLPPQYDPSSLALLKSRMVYFSGATLPRLSWKRGR